jgi:hypothetical protein
VHKKLLTQIIKLQLNRKAYLVTVYTYFSLLVKNLISTIHSSTANSIFFLLA